MTSATNPRGQIQGRKRDTIVADRWQQNIREYIHQHSISESAVIKKLCDISALARSRYPAAQQKGEEGIRKILNGTRRLPLNPKKLIEEIAHAVAELIPGARSTEDKQREFIDYVIDRATRALGSSSSSEESQAVGVPPFKQTRHGSYGNTIAGHLVRLGVPRHHLSLRDTFPRHNEVIGNALSLHRLSGERGLATENIQCVEKKASLEEWPTYLVDYWTKTSKPERNGALSFLSSWRPALIDEGSMLRLEFATMDWHMALALRDCSGHVQRDIQEGKRDFFNLFPCRIGMSVIVETTDRKLILFQRTPHVADDKGYWTVGIGELMRSDEDRNITYGLHPINAVRRGLQEEIGISNDVAERSTFTFLNLGISLNTFAYSLYCHACLQSTADDLIHCIVARARENERVGDPEVIAFELDTCLTMVVEGKYPKNHLGGSSAPITDWSRLSLLFSCMAQFGADAACAKLASM